VKDGRQLADSFYLCGEEEEKEDVTLVFVVCRGAEGKESAPSFLCEVA